MNNKIQIKEISIIPRTIKNYTHFSVIDSSIQTITSWRRSKTKFRINLIFNILSFGILHLISLFYPKLYIRLYCKTSLPIYSDFFLVEDIYGSSKLCQSIIRKINNKTFSINSRIFQNNNISPINNQTISFIYNYTTYCYHESTNSISAVYYNLNKTTNKNIVNCLSEGLSSEAIVNKHIQKYGDNNIPYKSNIILAHFFFIEIPHFIIVIFTGIIWIINNDLIFGIILIVLTFILVLIKLLYKYKVFYQKFKKHEKKDKLYKVKRKYLNTNSYELNEKKLVPGDVIYMNVEQNVPCDCLLLEGECIISECEIIGKTAVSRKICLKNNIENFNYLKNKDSIIYSGSKIVKCHSKLEDKSVVLLCINTGVNSFKTNLYANLLYFDKKNKNHNEYRILSFEKMWNTLLNLIIIMISIIILYIRYKYYKRKKNSNEIFKNFKLTKYILNCFAIQLIPIYHLALEVVNLFGCLNLYNENIQCVDEARLTTSGRISTIFLDKTGTLSEDKIEISGYHPIYKNENGNIYIKSLQKENIKSLCNEHLKYYKELIKNPNFNHSQISNLKLPVLFLQCIVTCHNLEKINNKMCGNLLEQDILKTMKWDISNINILNDNGDEEIFTEIFPKNYYKITEGVLKQQGHQINSFKLRIIQRFFNISSLNISSIVYNCLDGSLRFFTKGPPEKILKGCNTYSLTEDIDKLLRIFRLEGFRDLACASKIIDINSYNPDNDESFYLNNLTFCGFLTVKNNLRNETKEVIKKLKQMDCKLIINTGDNIFTTLAVGFESGIISDKSVYIFDKNDNDDDIIITHLHKSEKENEKEKKIESQLNQLLTNEFEKKTNLNSSLIHKRKISINSNTPFNLYNKPTFSNFINKNFLLYPNNSIPKKRIFNANLNLESSPTAYHIPILQNSSNSLNSKFKKRNSPNTPTIKKNNSFLNPSATFTFESTKLKKMKYNCVYCVSGKVFRFIYNNREEKKYSKLLKYFNHICKIYYGMSSDDKSLLINYYRTLENEIICMVGNGDNDIDSILSSHVGINLNIPKNIDNILSHYFTLDNNLYCIEKIIKNGRAAYENSFLLLSSILICSSLETLLNVFSYFLLVKFKNSQLLIMNAVFFVLSSTAFKMKADNSIDKNPLFQNRLFNIYNIIKMIVIFFSKITLQFFFYYLYNYNPNISDEINRKVLCSYLYLLCIFQGISTIFIFNKENFFRITAQNNKLFIVIFSIVLNFFFFIIGFSNINYRPFLFDIVYFEYYEINCDSYDDMHKLKLIIFISIDFFFTYGFIGFLKYIFEQQANKREREYLIKKMKYRQDEEKENEKEIKNKEEEEKKKVNQIFPSSEK